VAAPAQRQAALAAAAAPFVVQPCLCQASVCKVHAACMVVWRCACRPCAFHLLCVCVQDMAWTLWDRWVLEGDLTVQQVRMSM